MVDLSKIGTALSGFSAGVAGRLPEFQAGLEKKAERERLTEEQARQEQLLANRVLLGDLQAGNIDRSLSGLNTRLVGLNERGVNTDFTEGLKGLVESGPEGIQEAIRIAQAADQEAVTRGMLPPVAAPEVIPSSAISPAGQVATMDAGVISVQDIPGFRQAERGGMASAVTRAYGNGTVLQALPDGSTGVRNPAGEVVTGQERLDTLAAARQDELDFERTKAGAKAAGTQAIKLSGEAFEKLGNIDTAIANFDDAITALDEGAETGPIMSKLPSFRASSVQLDNIQGRLGLDVIGNTTFGALSESELAFALNTALPKNLQPAELRQWLVEKRDAQRKLRNYIEDAAIFLGVEGNTPADWLIAQREMRGQRPGPADGASTVIQFDAQGNPIQ